MFDLETPKQICDEVQRMVGSFPFIRPVFVDIFDRSTATDICKKATLTEWLITTRLDNDDALHPKYLETVRKAAVVGRREFLNVTRGLVVGRSRCYRKSDFSNAFISLSEPTSSLQTVWCDQHQWLRRHAPVRQLKLRDGWIQVVHGGNIANALRGVRAPLSSIETGVLPDGLIETTSESRLDIAFDNTFGLFDRTCRSAYRFARDKLRNWNKR